MRSLLLGPAFAAALLAACGSETPVAPVTAPATSAVVTNTFSASPPPALHNAACDLLTSAEVAAYNDGVPITPRGSLSGPTNGAFGLPVNIDICTWQADLANNIGPSIQVEITRARTVAEARKEFDALLAAIVKNTAPGATPVPVRGIGEEAQTVGQWIVVRHGTTVLSIAGTPAQGDTRAMLEALAANAASRIGR
jgi:hypothetical protein